MKKSLFQKILLFVALALVFVCTMSIVVFAEETVTDETTATDVVIENEHGSFTIPAAYADQEAYPWVSFNMDTKAFISASAVFAQDSGSIMSHAQYKVPNVLIVLRRDFTVTESTQWYNAAWHSGKNVVINLGDNTLTLAHRMNNGLFFGEAKTSGTASFTFENGNILYKTAKKFFQAFPRADKSGMNYSFTFRNIDFKVDDSVVPTASKNAFTIFSGTNQGLGNDLGVSFSFVNSNLDMSNIGSYIMMFEIGSNKSNINFSLSFTGGNIQGDMTRLAYYHGERWAPIQFVKDAEGKYTTNTVSQDASVPSRIFSSDEGLLTFNAENVTTLENGNKVYSPVVDTDVNLLPYGRLPADDTLVTVFNVSTQTVVYNGNVFCSSDTNSAMGITTGKGGPFLIYFRKDVPASATTGSCYNICNTSNTVVFELNGHTLTLSGRALFRAQVKATNAYQNLIVRNGIVNANGQSLVQCGSTNGSDGSKKENAIVNIYFNNVDLVDFGGGSSLVTDGLETDNPNTFNIYFDDCDISVKADYTGTLFNIGRFDNIKTNVYLNGGKIHFNDEIPGNVYSLNGGSHVSVTLGKGSDDLFTVITTAESDATVNEQMFNASDRVLRFIKTTTENGVSVWNVFEYTEYGYIDEAHFDRNTYPMAVFVVNKPFDTWYPVGYGNESAGTIVYEIYRSGSTYNKVDTVLYVRQNTSFAGSVWHCSPQNNFTIDLNGKTVDLQVILFRFQTRTSGTANIVVKNGTLNANRKSIITHGFQSNKTTNVTFENVVFNDLNRVFGEEAGSQNHTGQLTFHVTFNNCTFNVSSAASNCLIHFSSEAWWPTADIQINGGTINFAHNKYDLFYTTNAERIKLNFGQYNGEYTKIVAANTVNWSAVEYDLEGMPLQLVKQSSNDTQATFVYTPLSLVSVYLNLTHDINMVYRVFLPSGYLNPKATFTIGGDTVTVEEYTIDENGLYCFKFTGVAPHKMGDYVNAVVTATYNEKEQTISNDKVSIKGYADTLRTQYANDSAMLTLLDNLLVYGAASQVYMNYNLDALVAEVGELTAIPEALIKTTGTTSASANIAACGLLLDGAFDLRVGIKATTLEGLTLEITKGDITTTVALTEDMIQGDYVTVYYDGLYIDELDSEVTFTLKQNGEAVGKTVTFSATAYLYRMQSSEDTALANLTKALYAYGASAKAYNA